MGQRELWKLDDEAFAARRVALVQDVSEVRPLVTPVREMRQRLLWPHSGAMVFWALRPALVDFRQTKAYGVFWRFLRDELRLDNYIRRGAYRLEYLRFMHGDPQYRLYCGDLLLGVVDVTRRNLPVTQQQVALYTMSAYGFWRGKVYFTRQDALLRKYPVEGQHPALLT